MIPIELSQLEQEIVQLWAKKIQEGHEAVGDYWGDNAVTQEDPYIKKVHAYGAEWAFARIANLFPSLEVDHRGKPEDFTVTTALPHFTVDVKLARGDKVEQQRCYLVVDQEKLVKPEKRSDVYVLMWGVFPSYVYLGWAACRKVIDYGYFREGRVDASGKRRPCYFLAQGYLTKPLPTEVGVAP